MRDSICKDKTIYRIFKDYGDIRLGSCRYIFFCISGKITYVSTIFSWSRVEVL